MQTKAKPPLVTIITPHFRKIEFTKTAIRSINRQKGISHKEIQIIIVDENYNSETKKILQSLNRDILYLKTKELEGPGADRQTGLGLTKSKYVVFLDSDDQLNPNYLKQMTAVLEKNPQCSAAICQSESFFEPGFSLRHRLKLYPLMLVRDVSLFATRFNRNQLFPSAFYLCQLSHMLFRKESIKNFKFNYDYRRGGEDWDMVIHALQNGPIKVVHQKLLKFRYSPGSSTENPINQKLKWDSYSKLASRLPKLFRKGMYFKLFLHYIDLFKPKK